MASTTSSFIVSPAPEKRVKGDHWVDGTPKSFKNPWASFKDFSFMDLFSFSRGMSKRTSVDDPRDIPRVDELVPRTTPTWGSIEHADKMKATWMGHASYLVEMPQDSSSGVADTAKDAQRGVTILFDPAWSKRCSPVQFAGGPERYQPAAATVDQIPEIDIICLSHNHYDHQDTITLTNLYKRFSARPPVLCVGLNGTDSLPSSIPRSQIVEMDWWEERQVDVKGKGKVNIIFTPAQHMSKRGAFDTAKALWGGYAVKSIPSESSRPSYNLWFAGDTGYRATESESHDPKDNLDLPHCPAFKEIGERLGPFSLGLIPIGAYEPRYFLSSVHASPLDSVRIFQDAKVKKALGIHWGTWHMAWEAVDEPPKLLKTAREALGVTEEEFGVPVLGETRVFDP